MPANFSKIVADKKVRSKIREEILATETKYVEDLTILMTTFVLPLKEKKANDANFITAAEAQNLVSNLEMLASFHQLFLPHLQASNNISNVFLDYSDYFKMYTHYMNGY